LFSKWDRVELEGRHQFLLCFHVTYLLNNNTLTYLFHGAESFLRSYPVLRKSRNSPHFVEPEGLLSRLQEPATSPYFGPDQSVPCLPSHFLKIQLNIILPTTPGSSKWALSIRFPHPKPCINLSNKLYKTLRCL